MLVLIVVGTRARNGRRHDAQERKGSRVIVAIALAGACASGCYQSHARPADRDALDAGPRDPRCAISPRAFEGITLNFADECVLVGDPATWRDTFVFDSRTRRCWLWRCFCPRPDCDADFYDCVWNDDGGPAHEPSDDCYFASHDECVTTCGARHP